MSYPNAPPPAYGKDPHIPPAGTYPAPPAYGVNPSAPESSYLERFSNSVSPNTGTNGVSSSGFGDNAVRRLFIRKVYSILTIQLVFTGLIVFAFRTSDTLRDYAGPGGDGFWLYPVSWVFFFIVYCMLACPCCSFKRKFPVNIVLLVLMTITLSVAVGVMAVYYDTQAVLLAFASTALVVLVVTGLTFWTKFDITKFWYIVALAPLAMLLVWPFMFIFRTPAMLTFYCSLGVAVWTLYLAYDTRQIVGGGKHELNPEDYILAVVELYVDIVQIFLYFLQIFGRSD